eukprot:s127_g14.t1
MDRRVTCDFYRVFRGERGRVAKVTKDPQVRTLQQFVRAETEKSQATPAQKSQVAPDRSHKRPLYLLNVRAHVSDSICVMPHRMLQCLGIKALAMGLPSMMPVLHEAERSFNWQVLAGLPLG